MTRPARNRSLLLTALAALILLNVTNAAAQQKRGSGEEPQQALPDFDIRQAGQGQAALTAEASPGRTTFETKLATMVDVDERPVRYTLSAAGLPKMVSSANGLTGPSSGSPESIARRFLASPSGVSPFSQADLAALRLRARSTAGALQIVHLSQYAGEIPVYRSSVRVAVDAEGRVRSAAFSDPAPGVRLPNSLPTLSAERAARLALESVGVEVDGSLQARPDRNGRALFAHPSGGSELPVAAELVAFPMAPGVARLAWRVYADSGEGSYEILIGADDGAALRRVNLETEIGSGRVFPVTPLGPSEVRDFGEGWIADGTTVTTGNNADAYADIDGDDEPDELEVPGLQGGRAFSPSQQFDFDHGDGRNAGRTTRAGAVTNAFYHVNAAHDFFYGLGFQEVDGNFQADNFGRGGEGSDAALVEVHDRRVRNNATMRTRPDGLAPRIQFGLHTRVENEVRDSALDATVVMHEYTHGVTARAVGGPADVSCLQTTQADALSEGWSDYFGASVYDAPVIGEYLTGNPETGVRRARIDDNPRTFADLGDLRFQEHSDGEIWSATLWEIRGALGAEAADLLIYQALLLTACDPTYVDARDAILAIDGGANELQLWTIFAARGLGFAASASNSSAAVGTVFDANFDLPPRLAPGNRSPHITSVPTATAIMGEAYSYTVRSIDTDGDARTYELLSGPEGVAVDPVTGEMTWASPTFTPKRIQIAVTDGNGGRTVHGFELRTRANLTPGQPIQVSGERGSIGLGYVTVPADTDILQIRLRGDNGQADVILFSPDFDTEFSQLLGSNETLTIRDPDPGTWIARVDGRTTYSNISLQADLLTPTEISLRGEASGLSEARSGETFFKVVVPEATPLVRFSLTGGQGGDAELLLASGRVPICSSIFNTLPCDEDDSSRNDGSYELLTLENPEPGEYFVTVYAFSAYEDVTLRVSTSAPEAELGAATDGAAFQLQNAPGGISSLFGVNMANDSVAATTIPLPKELGGVRVVVDGIEAALFFVSPGQINFQLPRDVFGGDLYLVRNGELSDRLEISVSPAAPQVFVDPNTQLPILQHADGSLVTAENPARPGQVLIVYFTGIGFVNDMPLDGEAASANPLSQTLFRPRALLGNANLTVLFAGLTPGLVGLAQANVVMPETLPAVATLPLTLIIETSFSSYTSVPVDVPIAP